MGSYVNGNLMPGERVVQEAKVHWAVYIRPIIVFVIGVILSPFLIGIPLVLIALVGFLFAFITRRSTELVITDRRIIAKFGFIRRNTFEKHIERLEGINFHQGIIGRLLGYGTVSVGGLGGDSVPVPFIEDPQIFKNRLYELIERSPVHAKA